MRILDSRTGGVHHSSTAHLDPSRGASRSSTQKSRRTRSATGGRTPEPATSSGANFSRVIDEDRNAAGTVDDVSGTEPERTLPGTEILLRHLLATAGLGPLLLLQGRHVRRVTPRLPEPPGPRSGQAGVGAPFRLLIAGDSAAAGVGAASQNDGLAGRLVAELSACRALDWRLEGRTGYTTADAHKHLAALPEEGFDVVVLSLGVNDVTSGIGRRRWLARQAALADLLQAHFTPRALLFTALPPMHLFPALPQPLRWYLGARARDFNLALAHWLQHRPGCHLVVPDFQADPAHIATDGFHPGPAAYSAWAEQVSRHIDRLFPL